MSNIKARFTSSFTESAVIAGVAAVGTMVGADTALASAASSVGVMGMIPGSLRGPAVVFLLVFTADMVYNLFLA